MYAKIVRSILIVAILITCVSAHVIPESIGATRAMVDHPQPFVEKTEEVMSFPSLETKVTVSDTAYLVSQKYLIKPYKRLDFKNFADSLKHRESRGNYTVVNKWGYAGAYQFGKFAMRDLGIKRRDVFLKSKELQDAAFVGYVMINKYRLQKDIEKYSGKIINEILVTESGIIAAAHLKGSGNVQKWLRKGGKISDKEKQDALGTSLEEYMKKFAGYDISSIPAVRKVKIKIG